MPGYFTRNKMVDAEVTAITRIAELAFAMNSFKDAVIILIKPSTWHAPTTCRLKSQMPERLMRFMKNRRLSKRFYLSNRLKVISDSLFNIEKIKNINTVEAKLKVSEKEKTIALQKARHRKLLRAGRSRNRIALLIAALCYWCWFYFLPFMFI